MRLVGALSILVSLCSPLPSQQTAKAARRKPDKNPVCSPKAVCFSGEVSQGQEFRRSLNQDLEFILQPGWRITIAAKPPTGKCQDLVLWPYTATQVQVDEASAKLGSSLSGKGRLWITDSKVTHSGDAPDDKLGAIQWMKFTVAILLPPNAG